MAKDKAPAYQWYPKDARTDERFVLMSYEQQGIFRALLDHQWLEGSIPADVEALARLLKMSRAAFVRLWPAIEPCFSGVSGQHDRMINGRLERQRRDQEAFAESAASRGAKGAAKRWLKHSRSIAEPIANHGSSSSTASASAKERESLSLVQTFTNPNRDAFTDAAVTQRAGKFVERYQALYSKHRNGARYSVRPARDYAAAVTLCTTWTDDARLDKLATCFLTTDHKFAAEGSRTVPQFLALASWCDGELAEWEKQQAQA